MDYICSDTNIWIDFDTIKKLYIPFRLPEIFIMYNNAIKDEFIKSPDLDKRLFKLGLVGVEMTDEGLIFFQSASKIYRRLSKYDISALSIAKHRKIPLVTGDSRLRKEAERQGVSCMGTIGILDKLFELNLTTIQEHLVCLTSLYEDNSGTIMLPKKELESRIKRVTSIIHQKEKVGKQ